LTPGLSLDLLSVFSEGKMADFQDEMNHTVQQFVAQITELARRAALDTLEAAFGARGKATAAAGTMTNISAAGRPRGTRGSKRTAEDLRALSDQVVAFVKSNPGLRSEQINKALGTTTKDIALPIRKLVSEGRLSSKGQKRSTTYYPGRKAK
jgi:hypothetical protein